MPTSVTAAFEEFQKDTVNLDSGRTARARSSRDWLLGQIAGFDNQADFPTLYPDKHIFFGSFARRTKIRPLDDVDLMIALHAQGGVYNDYGDRIEITINPEAKGLPGLCSDNTTILNSRKVVNRFVSALKSVPQYEKADIGRNLEAAVLKLTSYDWDFDIVPCFFTQSDAIGRNFYLIPDGNGNWKKTDPRKDRDRVQALNSKHDGHVLNALRLMKYWNARPTMPSIPSYVLETVVLDYYETAASCSAYVDLELVPLFEYVGSRVLTPIWDPKGIQGDINTLTNEERGKVFIRAQLDHQRAVEARKLEDDKDHKASMKKWQEVLGPGFPEYA